VEEGILQRALAQIRANLSLFEGHGMLSSQEMESILSRIKVSTDPTEGIEDVELVTEAVSENLAVKKKSLQDVR
jgi:3-hydroxyacyl-CoA dehydrogenase